MKSLLIFIGSIVLTAILFSFPVLTALSFVFGWLGFWKWVLVIITSSEFIAATYCIWYEFNE